MTPEPTRLAYLDAMGLTAWVARYQLPNARETEACDWPEPVPEERPQPGAKGLHALLDDMPASAGGGDTSAGATEQAAVADSSSAVQAPAPQAPAGPRKARALLGDIVPDADDGAATPPTAMPAEDEAEEGAEPLRFGCQVACLDGRWLLLVARDEPLGPLHQRLLLNILTGAGVRPSQRPVFDSLAWPLEEGLPVRRPLDEARQGLKAFVAGRARRGWAPERVLVFGRQEALMQALAPSDTTDNSAQPPRSQTLALPLWQGPGLDELLAGDGVGAEAKRRLWSQIGEWQAQWSDGTRGDGAGGDGARDDSDGA
ncbi:hypothetical protein [Halomonas sp. S2151]|uniref:hypothetical protein n=1 Tax=Halomonas sp. S2151 TaxID=579478 RepID=UPI000B2DD2CE|nr:hypothetical protein [Halomonas sp. S2151]